MKKNLKGGTHLMLDEIRRKNRFLVIARVGDNSLHEEWLQPIKYKNFDLCLSYFGNQPNKYRNGCDFYFEAKGPKWPRIKDVIEAMGSQVFEYDAIWFPDDDIRTDAYNISRMFTLFAEQEFELAQPALTKDSYYSHFVTLENLDFLWRYTQFVEVMVPIFLKQTLERCWNTFDTNQTGWGLDLLWPKILGRNDRNMAIIDETPVTHTRPVGSGSLYRSLGLNPIEELHDIKQKYGLDSSTTTLPHYDGVLRGKKVLFMVLAHKNEDVLASQVQNIRHFNPNSNIILYNGGENKNFGVSLNIPICPYSRPIKWAYQAQVLLDVMKWLEETNVEYEYLVSLDHDMLFVKHGFEEFLDQSMQKLDCMGWQLLKGSEKEKYPDCRVPQSLWNEWDVWQPIFQTDDFLRYFNPGQVYRKGIIQRMLSYLQSIDQKNLEELIANTRVYGFEEMFCVTLAMACGGRCGEYPDGHEYNEAVRWGKNISLKEVKRVIKHPSYYWIHPIKDEKLVDMNKWLLSSTPEQDSKKVKDEICVDKFDTKKDMKRIRGEKAIQRRKDTDRKKKDALKLRLEKEKRESIEREKKKAAIKKRLEREKREEIEREKKKAAIKRRLEKEKREEIEREKKKRAAIKQRLEREQREAIERERKKRAMRESSERRGRRS